MNAAAATFFQYLTFFVFNLAQITKQLCSVYEIGGSGKRHMNSFYLLLHLLALSFLSYKFFLMGKMYYCL